jgi:hypothetical protein
MTERLLYHGTHDILDGTKPTIYGYVDKRFPLNGNLSDSFETGKSWALNSNCISGQGTILEYCIPEDKVVLLGHLGLFGQIYANVFGTTDRVRLVETPTDYLKRIYSYRDENSLRLLQSYEDQGILYFYRIDERFITRVIPVHGWKHKDFSKSLNY